MQFQLSTFYYFYSVHVEFKTSITPSDNCVCSDPECSDPLAAWPDVPYSASGCSEAWGTWACSRNHNRHQHPASIHVDSLHMMWCIPGTGAQGGSAFLRFALIVSRRQGRVARLREHRVIFGVHRSYTSSSYYKVIDLLTYMYT